MNELVSKRANEGREYPSRPLLGVGGFVFDEAGSLLMVRRPKEPARGRWSIPGGAVEVGETLRQAVVREVLEETGIVVEALGQVEVVERVLPDASGRIRFHYVLVDFLCRATDGRLIAGSDASAAEWVPAAEWQAEDCERIEGFTRPVLRSAWEMWLRHGSIDPIHL